jgi:hypothetical protein
MDRVAWLLVLLVGCSDAPVEQPAAPPDPARDYDAESYELVGRYDWAIGRLLATERLSLVLGERSGGEVELDSAVQVKRVYRGAEDLAFVVDPARSTLRVDASLLRSGTPPIIFDIDYEASPSDPELDAGGWRIDHAPRAERRLPRAGRTGRSPRLGVVFRRGRGGLPCAHTLVSATGPEGVADVRLTFRCPPGTRVRSAPRGPRRWRPSSPPRRRRPGRPAMPPVERNGRRRPSESSLRRWRAASTPRPRAASSTCRVSISAPRRRSPPCRRSPPAPPPSNYGSKPSPASPPRPIPPAATRRFRSTMPSPGRSSFARVSARRHPPRGFASCGAA